MNKLHKVLLFTALCFLLIACGPKAASDSDLATAIQAKLYANDATRAANVKVAVADGVVTLTGDVPSSDVALQAMNAASSTPGIKSVNNQLNVAAAAVAAVTPPPVAAPPVQNLAPNPPPSERESRRHEEMIKHEGDHNHDHDRDHGAPPPPPPPPPITIPAGQNIAVRMIDGIDTGHNQQGQTFHASLSAPITDGDRVIIPVGAPAIVLLADAKGAGRMMGSSELALRLTSIAYHGVDVPVSTGDYEAKGGSRGKQTAIRTGIGAAAGALIGGLAGGGKGAGIGAAAGGGAGAGFQLLTHGQQIKIPSETEINFRLSAPLVLNP